MNKKVLRDRKRRTARGISYPWCVLSGEGVWVIPVRCWPGGGYPCLVPGKGSGVGDTGTWLGYPPPHFPCPRTWLGTSTRTWLGYPLPTPAPSGQDLTRVPLHPTPASRQNLGYLPLPLAKDWDHRLWYPTLSPGGQTENITFLVLRTRAVIRLCIKFISVES